MFPILLKLAIVAVLPLSSVTPGALNVHVTQANIHTTICTNGYTSTIRPPANYTTGLKRWQLTNTYKIFADKNLAHYEEDHLISLELGGNPKDPKNLWPEPYASPNGARIKDQVENKLHALVCTGKITLVDAQKMISTNWYAAYLQYVAKK